MKLLYLLVLLSSLGYTKDILISFDGSGRLEMWRETLDFAKENKVKFTYFVSAPYYLTESEEQRNPYWAVKEVGPSPIEFRSEAVADKIPLRFDYMNRAVQEGHEIASHLCGHYVGSDFTYDQWMKEINYFNWTMTRNGRFDLSNITGIRAPCLAVNQAYFKAIRATGYQYDSSEVHTTTSIYQSACAIPVYRFKVTIADGSIRRILTFDYNFEIFYQKNKLSPAAMEQIYFDAACRDYLSDSPVTQICLHFTKYDQDPFMNAMKRFVYWAKDKNPRYLLYKEITKTIK